MEHRKEGFNSHILAVIAAGVCAVLAAGLVSTAVPTRAYADTAAEKQAEADAALSSLNNMLVELDQATSDYYAAQQRVTDAQATIDDQNQKIAGYQEQLSSRAKSMYRSGNSTFLEVLFGSESFTDFANNWDLLNNLNADDAQLVENTKTARAQVEASKVELTQQEDAAAQAQQIANETAQQMQATYESLSAEASEMLAAEQQAAAQQAQAQTQTVSSDQIASYDASTGYATLADGSTAKVTGWDGNGNAIVQLAMSFVGGTYVLGGSDAANRTFDCSGLVQYVYGQNGVSLNHYSEDIGHGGTVVSADQAQPGDILYWNGHVAIYAGNGMMVSADNPSKGINYEAIYGSPQYVSYR